LTFLSGRQNGFTPEGPRWRSNGHGQEGPDRTLARAPGGRDQRRAQPGGKGNILEHEYTIGEGWAKVAEVSKKWFRLHDTYGVEIEPGQEDILILAVSVCIN
jgi:hypothetical protein